MCTSRASHSGAGSIHRDMPNKAKIKRALFGAVTVIFAALLSGCAFCAVLIDPTKRGCWSTAAPTATMATPVGSKHDDVAFPATERQ